MGQFQKLAVVSLTAAMLFFAVFVALADGSQEFGRTPAADTTVVNPAVEPFDSVARIWDETLLNAIRIDRPKPPTHSRNLFHMSVAMWDAWAAYDSDAIGYITTEKHKSSDVEAAREAAISHAAFTLLMHRFQGGGYDAEGLPCQPGAAISHVVARGPETPRVNSTN